MEKERQEILEKLGKLKKEAQIEEAKRQIEESDAKRKQLSRRIFLLSWLGAVILPFVFFAFSFICTIIGMNSEIFTYPQFLQQQLMILSLGSISFGFVILLLVIRTIDSAAKRIPVPEFEVSFVTGLRSEKCKIKEQKIVVVCIKNKGEDIAENAHVFACFPPVFDVQENPHQGYGVFSQNILTDTPNYNAAVLTGVDLLPDTVAEIHILLTMPEKEGNYDIIIKIHEKKVGVHRDRLNIEIVG